jgi:hypothetical protein
MAKQNRSEQQAQFESNLLGVGEMLQQFENFRSNEQEALVFANEQVELVIQSTNNPESLNLMNSIDFESYSLAYRLTALMIGELSIDNTGLTLANLQDYLSLNTQNQRIHSLVLSSLEAQIDETIEESVAQNDQKTNITKAGMGKLLKNKTLDGIHRYLVDKNAIDRPSNSKSRDITQALSKAEVLSSNMIYPFDLHHEESARRVGLIQIVKHEKKGVYTGLQSMRSQALLLISSVTTNEDKYAIEQFVTNSGEIPYDEELFDETTRTIERTRLLKADPIEIDAISSSIDARIVMKYLTPELATRLVEESYKAITSTTFTLTGELSFSFEAIVRETLNMSPVEKAQYFYSLIEEHASTPASWCEMIRYSTEITAIGELDPLQTPPIFAIRTLVSRVLGASANCNIYYHDRSAQTNTKTASTILEIWLNSEDYQQSNSIPVLAHFGSQLGKIYGEPVINSLMVRFDHELRGYLILPKDQEISYHAKPLDFITTELESLSLENALSQVQSFYSALLGATSTLYVFNASKLTPDQVIEPLTAQEIDLAMIQAARKSGLTIRKLTYIEYQELIAYVHRFNLLNMNREDKLFYFLPQTSDERGLIQQILGEVKEGYQILRGVDLTQYTYTRIQELIASSGSTADAKQVYRAMLSTLHHYFYGKPVSETTTRFVHQGYMLGEHRAMEGVQEYAYGVSQAGSQRYKQISTDQQAFNFELSRNALISIRESHPGYPNISEQQIQSFIEKIEELRGCSTTFSFVAELTNCPDAVVYIPTDKEDEVVTAFQRLIPGLNKKGTLAIAKLIMSDQRSIELINQPTTPETFHRELSTVYTQLINQLEETWSLFRDISGEKLPYKPVRPQLYSPSTVLQSEIEPTIILQAIGAFQSAIAQLNSTPIPNQITMWSNLRNWHIETANRIMNVSPQIKDAGQGLARSVTKANQIENSAEILEFWMKIINKIHPHMTKINSLQELYDSIKYLQLEDQDRTKRQMDMALFDHPLLQAYADFIARYPNGDNILEAAISQRTIEQATVKQRVLDILLPQKRERGQPDPGPATLVAESIDAITAEDSSIQAIRTYAAIIQEQLEILKSHLSSIISILGEETTQKLEQVEQKPTVTHTPKKKRQYKRKERRRPDWLDMED